MVRSEKCSWCFVVSRPRHLTGKRFYEVSNRVKLSFQPVIHPYVTNNTYLIKKTGDLSLKGNKGDATAFPLDPLIARPGLNIARPGLNI